jgi:hypothetical protein
MKKLICIIFAFGLVLLVSCELDINRDPNYPTEVGAEKFFSSGLIWTSSAIGCDLQLIGGMWAQHWAQHANSNQYNNIDSYNLQNSSTYVSRSWSMLYSGALTDFQEVIKRSESTNSWNYWMAAKIMTAYCFNVLADSYGDIPFSEALNFNLYINPKFDDSKTVNQNIIAILDAAIAKRTDAELSTVSMGSTDILFGGDISLWTRFAKSLKLKILMRDPSFTSNQSAISALINENDLLNADCKITIFEDKENNSNPLYENDRRKLNTPQNIRASSTLARFLFENNDPRAAAFMEKAFTPDPVYGEYVGIPQGGYTLGSSWGNRTSRAVILATDPVWFMSYAEVEFLKAEVYVKLGNFTSAKSCYDKAVGLAFERWGNEVDADNNLVIPPSFDLDNFIGAGKPYEFNQTSSETMLQSIWRQKWIAAVRCQEWEAFLESNRTGYPAKGLLTTLDPLYVTGNFALSINSVLPTGEWPRRLIYPKTSSDYNLNTPVVIPIQTKMWWHK